MSQTAPTAADSALAAHVADGMTPNVGHIWMPSQRSLCELAVRRVVETPEDATAAHEISRALPACQACLYVTEMLQVSARQLKELHGGKAAPSVAEAVDMLGKTTWIWVASSLVKSTKGTES